MTDTTRFESEARSGLSDSNAGLDALECALLTMSHLEAHRNMLSKQLTRLRDVLEPAYETSPEGRAELDRIERALNYDF